MGGLLAGPVSLAAILKCRMKEHSKGDRQGSNISRDTTGAGSHGIMHTVYVAKGAQSHTSCNSAKQNEEQSQKKPKLSLLR